MAHKTLDIAETTNCASLFEATCLSLRSVHSGGVNVNTKGAFGFAVVYKMYPINMTFDNMRVLMWQIRHVEISQQLALCCSRGG